MRTGPARARSALWYQKLDFRSKILSNIEKAQSRAHLIPPRTGGECERFDVQATSTSNTIRSESNAFDLHIVEQFSELSNRSTPEIIR